MKYKDLKKDKMVREWFANLSPGEATKDTYLYSLQEYTDLFKMSPSKLIEEAEADITLGVLPRKRKIRSHLLEFKQHLINKGLSDFSVRNRLTGVRSFYAAFEIEIPKQMSERRRAMTIKENDDIPTKEDIRDILKVADPLEKAIVLTGVSAGLASNEIRNLLVSDFIKGYDPVTDITTLDLRRFKARVDFITFLTPEASQAVKDYLEYRNREAKAPTARRKRQLEKQRVTDDSYLFILRQVPPKYEKTHDEELRKLTDNAITKLFATLSEKAKKNTKTGVYNFIRSHTMRKVFSSTLQNAGAPYLFVEQCLGHKISNTDKAYSRPNVETNKEIYKKFIPYLTIEKNLDVSTNPEYLKAIADKEKAEAEAYRVSVERAELQQLRNEVEQMKEIEKKLPELIRVLMSDPDAVELMKKIER